MITEEEARRQNLPGSNVFIKTQRAYKNEHNRDALIVHLNREAYKAFLDTILIGQYPRLRQEMELTKKDWTIFTPAHFQKLEYIDLENLKIAAGLEMHLKACMLAQDIIIHIINNTSASFRTLRRKQQDEPVYKSELLAIEGFYYNGQMNILRGLTSQSLNFEKIVNNLNYQNKLGKTQDFLDIVEDYRNLRNQIHLPGDAIDAPHINQYQGEDFMRLFVQFINDEIVEHNNQLIDKWGLNPAQKVRCHPECWLFGTFRAEFATQFRRKR